MGVKFEHWKICEWAVKSIQAYKDMHFTNDTKEISMSKDEMIDYLYNKGISSNYNEPMTKNQISRLNEKKLKTIIENIEITHNLVNIQQVKGQDLEIVDTDKYEYILTYSFPCQDLSLAGKGKGMADTSTRSGMLWEVERILNELKETNSLPQILLMENVPQVHGTGNVEHFNKWQLALEKLGYKNYFQDLIATDYGIPQTRNRCFMVSILGDYSYSFPQKIPLKLKLKDLLEKEVDEKYYLSDKMLDYCYGVNHKESKFPRKRNRPTDNFVFNKALKETLEQNKIKQDISFVDGYNKKIRDDGLSSTITARVNDSNNTFIAIKNATKKGYLEASDGDGINLSNRMEHQRGNVQKDKIQTLTTSGGNDRGVCVGTYQYSKSDKFMNVKDRLQLGKDVSDTLQTTPKEGVVTIGNYSKSNHNASRIVNKNYSAPTVMENHGTITAIQSNDLRIRKLTSRECGRLMNVKDEDITKMLKNQSDSSAYHCFGDSICTNCLMAIFGELLDINWKQKLEEMLYGNTN